MRSIRVSDEVWVAIAAKGRFGETEDDVLRRVLNVTENSTSLKASPNHSRTSGTTRPRAGYASIRMSADVRSDQLTINFDSGEKKTFQLPKRTETEGIRRVRTEAVLWARANGASAGQEDAVKKALTTAGYHIRGPRK